LHSKPAPDALAGEVNCDATGFCNDADQDLSFGYENPGDSMEMNKSALANLKAEVAASLHAHWQSFLAEGVILLILGVVAIVLPLLATIAVEIIVGWLFLISGIIGLVTTLRMRRAPGFWWSLLSAILAVVVGAILLWWPLRGVLTLTVVLTVFFIVEGIASIMYALEHKRELSGRWGLMLFSGVTDLILAGLIYFELPGSAAWAIGLLVGINLAFGGAALIAMALDARTNAPAARAPTH
jgi:uncharacterized membrane protein HdeD (DUF308 family)